MNSCLVVEDSRLARLEIVRLLKELDYFSQINVASNFGEAKEIFKKTDPDVIFLDIDLPGKNGFEFLESLDHIPNVIFTTAFEEFAIKSYDYNAIDYVLKPIKKERLEQAIAKIQTRYEEGRSNTQHLEKVFVRDGEKFWLVQMKDIRIF